jgi:hypothetical protein
MKKLMLASILLLGNIAIVNAQGKYFTRDGKVSFNSDAPLEKIEANNSKASSVMDASTGQMEFSVLMKAFEFEKALMQEHFNENYVESTKFPKSVFKGKVDNIGDVNFNKDGIYPVKVSGSLTLHGVTRPVSTNGTIEVKNGKPSAVSAFSILLSDYNIEIPKLVEGKVSNEVKIKVNVNYEPLGS